tara:strand:- start:89961 stop:90260 length:300 start_codon:yes stop_codon:yes gene_type:complete
VAGLGEWDVSKVTFLGTPCPEEGSVREKRIKKMFPELKINKYDCFLFLSQFFPKQKPSPNIHRLTKQILAIFMETIYVIFCAGRCPACLKISKPTKTIL